MLIASVWSMFAVIPKTKKEEEIYSREFWMFIGSLVLLVSAFQVAFTTSIPVFSKMFGLNIAPPVDVISHYNRFQMPLAIIVAILTGVSQLLKYKKNSTAIKQIGMHAGIALVVAFGLMFFFKLENWFYMGLLFASVYALSANISILLPILRGKTKMSGSSIAHIGFAILLMGVLVSSANKKVISVNQSGMMLNPEFDSKANAEHVYLERGKALRMGDYEIEYIGDSTQWVNNYYQVHYKKIDPKTNQVEYEFDLYPNGQINPKMGLVANPDTKHYFSHDVFTYISSVPKDKTESKFINPKNHQILKGDTIVTDKAFIVLKNISSNIKDPDAKIDRQNMQLLLAADFDVFMLNKKFSTQAIYGIQNNGVVSYPGIVEEAALQIRFVGVDPKTGRIAIETADKDMSNEFIIMKAIEFPWINLVWGGTIIMIVGFMFAIFRRVKEFRRHKDDDFLAPDVKDQSAA